MLDLLFITTASQMNAVIFDIAYDLLAVQWTFPRIGAKDQSN